MKETDHIRIEKKLKAELLDEQQIRGEKSVNVTIWRILRYGRKHGISKEMKEKSMELEKIYLAYYSEELAEIIMMIRQLAEEARINKNPEVSVLIGEARGEVKRILTEALKLAVDGSLETSKISDFLGEMASE